MPCTRREGAPRPPEAVDGRANDACAIGAVHPQSKSERHAMRTECGRPDGPPFQYTARDGSPKSMARSITTRRRHLRQERSAGSRAQLLPPEEPSRGARHDCIVLRLGRRTDRDARRRYVRSIDGKRTSEPPKIRIARASARTFLIRQARRQLALADHERRRRRADVAGGIGDADRERVRAAREAGGQLDAQVLG